MWLFCAFTWNPFKLLISPFSRSAVKYVIVCFLRILADPVAIYKTGVDRKRVKMKDCMY